MLLRWGGVERKSSILKKRTKQMTDIVEFFRFERLYDLKFEASRLENIEKNTIIAAIDACFKEIKPEWIILPDPNDAHKDHQITFESCMACSKIFRYPYIKKITTMEIVSETDFGEPKNIFVPNYFVDISNTIEDKLKALSIYDTEIGKPPFPRSIEAVKAQALVRGGTAGVHYAEAFRLIKQID